jgi:hypothetical protein
MMKYYLLLLIILLRLKDTWFHRGANDILNMPKSSPPLGLHEAILWLARLPFIYFYLSTSTMVI